MDKNPPGLADDQIKVHSSVRKFLEKCGEGSWIGKTLCCVRSRAGDIHCTGT
jgi:hypothetical protein